MSNNTPVLLSVLPYIDENYEEKEDEINNLIAQEMATFTPPNYLTKFPNISLQFDDLLTQEFERVQRGDKLDGLDTTRYQLEVPNQDSDIKLWKDALKNAECQLEQQYLRLTNLELLQTYGANAWKKYNEYLENQHRRLSLLLDAVKKEIEELNSQRKSEQTACGATLRSLESKWKTLVYKNLDIEAACVDLEKEIAKMTEKQ